MASRGPSQHWPAKSMVSSSNGLFMHHLHPEPHLPLLVWEQATAPASKAEPSCQVSAQFLTSTKSGEGSLSAATAPQILLITAALPTNLPRQANSLIPHSVPALIRERHLGRCVRAPGSSGPAGLHCQVGAFTQKILTHFSCRRRARGGVKCGSRQRLWMPAKSC